MGIELRSDSGDKDSDEGLGQQLSAALSGARTWDKGLGLYIKEPTTRDNQSPDKH